MMLMREKTLRKCLGEMVTVSASGVSGIYNFLTSLNFIQSHMVHVMTRKYISLFCDHKERNNF